MLWLLLIFLVIFVSLLLVARYSQELSKLINASRQVDFYQAPRTRLFSMPQNQMVGKTGKVFTRLGQGTKGLVRVEGELWKATLISQDGIGLPVSLERGAPVKIIEQRDLWLIVEPLPNPRTGW